MGQPLPLPERIPLPNDERTKIALAEAGVRLHAEDNARYVKYTLPEGWRLVDDSWRQDLPDYYLLDAENMKRFSIFGSWKGAYDNALRIRVIKEPKLFKGRNEPMQASETSDIALINKLTGDKMELPEHAEREPDFQSPNCLETGCDY